MTTETQAAPKADDFADAFASFSKDETPPADTTAAAAPAATETPAAGGAANDTGGSGDPAPAAGSGDPAGGAGDGVVGDGKTAETVAPANTEDKGAALAAAPASGAAPAGDAGSGAAPVAPAAEAPKPDAADAILDKLGKLVEAAQTPKPAEEKKPEEKTSESPYTPEQTAELEQYHKDWPDVAKFEGLKRQGEYKQLLDFVFGEVRKYVDPLRETLDTLAGRTHLTDVKAAVTDYSDDLRQQVVEWAKKQPTYLQTAYNHVIENGTVEEVKDLVDRFRQATGVAAPAPGGAPAGQSEQGSGRTNELSGAAKEAAAALAPVESKRSEVVGSGDPSTFEDAWKQFAKDL